VVSSEVENDERERDADDDTGGDEEGEEGQNSLPTIIPTIEPTIATATPYQYMRFSRLVIATSCPSSSPRLRKNPSHLKAALVTIDSGKFFQLRFLG
jgi:hypothetical protein